jgi:hypothetical protein
MHCTFVSMSSSSLSLILSSALSSSSMSLSASLFTSSSLPFFYGVLSVVPLRFRRRPFYFYFADQDWFGLHQPLLHPPHHCPPSRRCVLFHGSMSPHFFPFFVSFLLLPNLVPNLVLCDLCHFDYFIYIWLTRNCSCFIVPIAFTGCVILVSVNYCVTGLASFSLGTLVVLRSW